MWICVWNVCTCDLCTVSKAPFPLVPTLMHSARIATTRLGSTGFPLHSSPNVRGCCHGNPAEHPVMKCDMNARGYTCCSVFGFSSASGSMVLCFVAISLAGLIFVNGTFSRLIEWCWPTNRRPAVWRHHILVHARIAWKPGWAGTKKNTRYHILWPNGKARKSRRTVLRRY